MQTPSNRSAWIRSPIVKQRFYPTTLQSPNFLSGTTLSVVFSSPLFHSLFICSSSYSLSFLFASHLFFSFLPRERVNSRKIKQRWIPTAAMFCCTLIAVVNQPFVLFFHLHLFLQPLQCTTAFCLFISWFKSSDAYYYCHFSGPLNP